MCLGTYRKEWRDDLSTDTHSSEAQIAGWRIKLGAVLFGISIVMPVAGIPLVTTLGLSTKMTASVSGGLLMFCLPLLFGWLAPYISKWVPGLLSYPLPFAIGGDILIVVSLYVLGGEFWDKIRSLFIHDAKASFFQ